MTTATQAYEAYLDFLDREGIEVRQDETARAVLRAMHDHLDGRYMKRLIEIKETNSKRSAHNNNNPK